MCRLSIVFGAAKYSLVTSCWSGDILKKGPSSVCFSIPGADCAMRKSGCWAIAVTSFGNCENVFNAWTFCQHNVQFKSTTTPDVPEYKACSYHSWTFVKAVNSDQPRPLLAYLGYFHPHQIVPWLRLESQGRYRGLLQIRQAGKESRSQLRDCFLGWRMSAIHHQLHLVTDP